MDPESRGSGIAPDKSHLGEYRSALTGQWVPDGGPSPFIAIPPAAPAVALQDGPGRLASVDEEDRRSQIDIHITSDGAKVTAREKKAAKSVQTTLKVSTPMPSAGL